MSTQCIDRSFGIIPKDDQKSNIKVNDTAALTQVIACSITADRIMAGTLVADNASVTQTKFPIIGNGSTEFPVDIFPGSDAGDIIQWTGTEWIITANIALFSKRTAFVSPTFGNDALAVLEKPESPYSTIAAALVALSVLAGSDPVVLYLDRDNYTINQTLSGPAAGKTAMVIYVESGSQVIIEPATNLITSAATQQVILIGDGADFSVTAGIVPLLSSSGGNISWTSNSIMYDAGFGGEFLSVSVADAYSPSIYIKASNFISISQVLTSLTLLQGNVSLVASSITLFGGYTIPVSGRVLIQGNKIVTDVSANFAVSGQLKITASQIQNDAVTLTLNAVTATSSILIQAAQLTGGNVTLAGSNEGHITLLLGDLNINALTWTNANDFISNIKVNRVSTTSMSIGNNGKHLLDANRVSVSGTITQTALASAGDSFEMKTVDLVANGAVTLNGTSNLEASVKFVAAYAQINNALSIGSLFSHTVGRLSVEFNRTDADTIANSLVISTGGVGAEVHVSLGRLSHNGIATATMNNGGFIHIYKTYLDSTLDSNPGSLVMSSNGATDNNGSQYLVEDCIFQGTGQCNLFGTFSVTWRLYNTNFYSSTGAAFVLAGQAAATGGCRVYAEGCLFRSTVDNATAFNRTTVTGGGTPDSLFFKSCHFETAAVGISVPVPANWTAESYSFSGCTVGNTTASVSAGAHLNTNYTFPNPASATARTFWVPPF